MTDDTRAGAVGGRTVELSELLEWWNSGEGKPHKGDLIDWNSYVGNGEPPLSCMCAQGQVLHLLGGREPQRLRDVGQFEADRETAKLLNISLSHAILLRNVNDKSDGAPSIVLTDPGKVLGDQWSKLLDLWWAFGQFDAYQWKKVADFKAAAGAAAWDTARTAAEDAAKDAVGDAAEDAFRATIGDAAVAAAWEIQGFEVLTSRGQDVFFLPMFDWASPADIPARPADYGNGVVPA